MGSRRGFSFGLHLIFDTTISSERCSVLEWNILTRQRFFIRWLISTDQEDKIWILIWKIKIPYKVRFFIWQCGHNILPTLSFLKKKRNIITQDLGKWCLSEPEDREHVLWRCQIAKKARSVFSDWLEVDIKNIQDFNIRNLLLKMQKKDKTSGGCLCLAALLWTIWLLRNEYTYKDTRINFLKIGFLLKHRAYSWTKTMELVHENHHAIWVVNLLQALRTHRILNLRLALHN